MLCSLYVIQTEKVASIQRKRKKKQATSRVDRLKALYPFSFFAREKVFKKGSRNVRERESGFSKYGSCKIRKSFYLSSTVSISYQMSTLAEKYDFLDRNLHAFNAKLC